MSLKQSLDRSSHGTTTGTVRTPSGRSADHDGLGDEQKGSRQGSGPFGSEQGATHGTGKGTPKTYGPLKQATLAQSWGQGASHRGLPSKSPSEGPGEASTPAGDCPQDSETGLQLGAVRSTWKSGPGSTPLRCSAEMEESSGGGHHHNGAAHLVAWVSHPDAAHGAEGHRRRNDDPVPKEGGGDEMAEGRTMVLPEMAPCTREPGRGRDKGPAEARQADGDNAGSAAPDHAALHGPPFPRDQAPDRDHHVPARCVQQNPWAPKGMGVPGNDDRPDSSSSHRTTAQTRFSQAVTGCGACATSIGRLLLIKLLNSSNTCYINASARAWLYTVSHLQVADVLK